MMRRVSTYLFECCQVRSVQEALFTAPLDLESLEHKYEEGDEVQLHPALAEVEYYVFNDYIAWGDPMPEYSDNLFIGEGKAFHRFERTVGEENATNPPVYRIKFLDLDRTSDDLRNYQWNSACYSCWQARNDLIKPGDDEACFHHECNDWLTDRGNDPHEVRDLNSSSIEPSDSASDSSSLMDEVEPEEEAAAIDIPHYLNWKAKQERLQKKEGKARERERDLVLLPTSVFKAVTVFDVLENLQQEFMTGSYFGRLRFKDGWDDGSLKKDFIAKTVICSSEPVDAARLFVDQKGSLVADMNHYRLAK